MVSGQCLLEILGLKSAEVDEDQTPDLPSKGSKSKKDS